MAIAADGRHDPVATDEDKKPAAPGQLAWR